MKAIDFNYNGLLASNFGLVICNFDSSGGLETVSIGSELSLDTISLFNGNKYALVNTSYNEVNYTFSICKYRCENGEIRPLTTDECREITRWLNRNDGYFPLEILQDGYENIIFEGTFNLSAIKFDGEVYGFELTFITNRPFAIQKQSKHIIDFSSIDKNYVITDQSDNIGYIYPKIRIKCNASGDLHIYNSNEKRTTIIKNCTLNEIITFDEYLNMSTTSSGHKLFNDFNFVFFRISNSYNDRNNTISVNLPCEIEIEYYPIVKGVGL